MNQSLKKPLIFLLSISLLVSVIYLSLSISGRLQTSKLPWKKLQPDSQTQLELEQQTDLQGEPDFTAEPTGIEAGDEIGTEMGVEPDQPVGSDNYLSDDSDDDFQDEASYTWISKKEQTAFDLLQEQAEIEYEQYDFGVMIKSINDLAADNQHYWAFYVNGEYSQVGADQAQLQSGDEVRWQLEAIQ